MNFLPPAFITIAMLVLSNVFMTFAWYGHLKNAQNKAWYAAAILSWGIALFEYLLQVPANRIGHQVYTLPQLKQIFEKWQTGLEEKGWNSLFWGNHDFPRVVSRFGNDREPYREKSAKMLAVLLHGMKGTPYIYQGEEIGMTNVSGLRIEDYQDIESVNFAEDRKKEGWEEEKIRTYLARNSRDHARTPMQWNAEKHAGFTAGTPWMAENQNYEEINVENSRKNPDSLFYFYQKLIALRRKNDTLVYGDFRLIEEENPDIFAYERNLGEKKLIVLCNFRDTAAEMKARYDLTKGTVLIHNDTESLTKEVWKLQPYEAYMIELLQ